MSTQPSKPALTQMEKSHGEIGGVESQHQTKQDKKKKNPWLGKLHTTIVKYAAAHFDIYL